MSNLKELRSAFNPQKLTPAAMDGEEFYQQTACSGNQA